MYLRRNTVRSADGWFWIVLTGLIISLIMVLFPTYYRGLVAVFAGAFGITCLIAGKVYGPEAVADLAQFAAFGFAVMAFTCLIFFLQVIGIVPAFWPL